LLYFIRLVTAIVIAVNGESLVLHAEGISMATVSMASCVASKGAWSTETKVKSSGQMSLNRHELKYDGLRSLNKVLVRSTHASKMGSSLAAKSSKSGREKVLEKIECGMNLIFVGAEVAPWSKTGGLGDVLGGLPSALAVSGLLIYFSYLF